MIGASRSKGSQSVVKRLRWSTSCRGHLYSGSNNVGLFVTGRTEVALQSAYSHSRWENNGGFMENVRRVQGMGGETLKWGTQTWTLAYGQSHWLKPESELTLHVSMDAQGLLRVENQTGQVLESCRGDSNRWQTATVGHLGQPEETKEVSATLFDTEPNGMYTIRTSLKMGDCCALDDYTHKRCVGALQSRDARVYDVSMVFSAK